VFALDARIHVIVQQLHKGKGGKTTMRELTSRAMQPVGSGTTDDGVLGTGPETGEPMEGVEGEASVAKTDAQHEELKGKDGEEEVIIVKSPQFLDAVWEYGVQRMEDGGGVKVVQLGNG
jgi:phosphomevalonate kinase